MNVMLYRLNRDFVVFLTAIVITLFSFTGLGRSAEPADIKMENGPVRTIVLDPGHGGYDSGVIGPEGTTEKSVTLAIARLIDSQLEGRYRVMLTRTGDYLVEITDRIAFANHNRADLFLSLHVGGGFSIQCNSVAVFSINTENETAQDPDDYSASGFATGPPIIIWNDAQYDHQRLNKAFADILEQFFQVAFGKCSRIKYDRIAVLEGADMPAAMIEIGCLPNPDWDKQFRDPERLVAISNMISESIVRFFQTE